MKERGYELQEAAVQSMGGWTTFGISCFDASRRNRPTAEAVPLLFAAGAGGALLLLAGGPAPGMIPLADGHRCAAVEQAAPAALFAGGVVGVGHSEQGWR